MTNLGTKALLMIPFNRGFTCMTSEEFVLKILYQELGVKGVVVGFNYKFGYEGRGTAALLKDISNFLGFQTVVIPPVKVDNCAVSSTRGEVKKAAKYLGFYPFVEGTVVGEKRGGNLFCSIVILE
jgi:riboflavin kinase/FMN adenylyltransferase